MNPVFIIYLSTLLVFSVEGGVGHVVQFVIAHAGENDRDKGGGISYGDGDETTVVLLIREHLGRWRM